MTYQRPMITEIGKAQHLIQGAGRDQTDPDKMSWNIVCADGQLESASSESSFLESMLNLLGMLFG